MLTNIQVLTSIVYLHELSLRQIESWQRSLNNNFILVCRVITILYMITAQLFYFKYTDLKT